MRSIRLAAICAVAFLSAQPCLAAEQFAAAPGMERRSSSFAGLTLRLAPGERRSAPTLSARLRLTALAQGGSSALGKPSGVEIGFDRVGKPTYHIAGQNVRELEKRLHMKGSTPWLIVGGVVVVVLVLAAVAGAQPTAGPPDGAFD